MGNLTITGSTRPEIGKDNHYSIFQTGGNHTISNPLYPTSVEKAEWQIFVFEKKKWRETGGNKKLGDSVSYNFKQSSLVREGIKIVVTKGNDRGELIIKTKRAGQPKINSIQLLDVNGRPVIKPLNYFDVLLAKAECTDMEGETLHFTLWEDDAPRTGHNVINEINKINPIPISQTVINGKAEVRFNMAFYTQASMIANMQLAKGDKNEGKNHEYYVTADYYGKLEASNNINITNPDFSNPIQRAIDLKYPDKTPQKPKVNKHPTPPPRAPKKDTYKTPLTPKAKTKAKDQKGKIISAEFVDFLGKPYQTMKFGTQVKAKIISTGMKGKTIKLIIWEDDIFDQSVYENNYILSGDTSYATLTLTEKMRENGDDYAEGKEQEYFLEIEYAGQSINSKIVNVNDSAPKIKVETGVSTSGVKAKKVEQKKEETCVCKQYNLIWGNKVSCEFRKKVVEISQDLWPNNHMKMANNLMAVFRWESGGTFKTDAPNQANSGGTGLIQFMPSTAKALLGKEVTIEIVKNYYGKKYNKNTKQKEDWYLKRVKEFADMTSIQQLDYVKKHFEPLRGKSVDFVDFYLQVLFPASSQKEEHIVFASSLSKLTTRISESEKLRNLRVTAYNSNKGLDINKDGIIWKSEIKTKVQVYITEGLLNKETKFECNNQNELKENRETTFDCKTNCICNLEMISVVNGFIDNSQINKHRVDVLEQSKFTDSKKLSGIILHRTVTKTTQATINAFSNKRLGVYYGTHFIVGKDGDITQTAHLDYKTNHAKGWNSKSIGIEVVGMPIDKDGSPTIDDKRIVGWEEVTEKQAKSVACLTKALLKYYSLKFEDLHCHEDVASKTKGEGKYVLKAIQPYYK